MQERTDELEKKTSRNTWKWTLRVDMTLKLKRCVLFRFPCRLAHFILRWEYSGKWRTCCACVWKKWKNTGRKSNDVLTNVGHKPHVRPQRLKLEVHLLQIVTFIADSGFWSTDSDRYLINWVVIMDVAAEWWYPKDFEVHSIFSGKRLWPDETIITLETIRAHSQAKCLMSI